MLTIKIIIGIVLLVVSSANAWGATGHHTVGYIAMQFLSQRALSFVKSSLGSNYSFSLGPAATWADEIKSDPSYAWASNLHFVDAEDNPPSSCSVVQARDCADGRCVLTAIANYTSRVVDKHLSRAQRQEALKFLDHFIGDIGQPLHAEARALGGNQISVTCNASTTNLHTVWDSRLVDKLVNANYQGSITTWAHALTTRIKRGSYAPFAHSWLSCSLTARQRTSMLEDISGFLGHHGQKILQCPLAWARDSNEFDCSFVFNFSNGTDLCNSNYYKKAVPLIEAQIAKQGYRLAAWLNVLFDGHFD